MITDKDKEDARELELRSEQLRDILGQVPRWVVRYGTLVIFCIILVLVLGASLLKYPDIISAKLVLTTEVPPAQLIAKSTSKIDKLLVGDKELVEEGQLLAVLNSSADYPDVMLLKDLLGGYFNYDSLMNRHFPEKLMLGSNQETYAVFQKRMQENQSFIAQNNYGRMISFYTSSLSKYIRLLEDKKAEVEAAGRVYTLAGRKFSRDSSLYAQSPGSLAPVELEKSEQEMLQTLKSWKSAKAQLSTADIEVSNLQQQILETELKLLEASSSQIQVMQEAYEKLTGQMADWEEKYILQAPFRGEVSFAGIWSESQNVNEGEVVLTVLPSEEGRIIGKALLNTDGIGKVKVGQKVILRLDNFPHLEFGTLKGTVSSISPVPVNGLYSAEIQMDSSNLVTNYDRKLPFNQNMQGVAEIITDERSLLGRIMEPFRSAIKRQAVLED